MPGTMASKDSVAMKRATKRQSVLKPQDLAVAFKLVALKVAPLKEMILSSDELPPVWPHPDGNLRGQGLLPLYEAIPLAAQDDPDFYALLALFDTLRIGQARERELAAKLLQERIR